MKNRGLTDSFRSAWQGVKHASAHERNFKIHLVCAALAVAACIVLRVERTLFFMVIVSIFFVLAAELFNTAIEAAVDLACGQKPHPLAKIAKDTAAAAVMLAAVQAVIVAVIVALSLLTGCSGGEKEVFTYVEDVYIPFVPPTAPKTFPEPKPKPPEQSPKPEPQTEWFSRLTGLAVSEEVYGRRPVAVMVNNLYRALPQAGISQAAVIHEVLAEGEITRLIAVFDDFDAAKIGPVRSARDYFVDIALDYDALFVHHGGSDSGYGAIGRLGVNNLDGIRLEGRYFWRDRAYPDWDRFYAGDTRPLEHSSYTGIEEIWTAAEQFGYRAVLREDADYGYGFYAGGEAIPGEPHATEIRVPFSRDYTRVFNYDAETGLYAVSNRDGPHMDELTAEGLAVSNVVIQLAPVSVIPGDNYGRREVKVVGGGRGYLLTAGVCVPLTWEKDSSTAPTRWYFEDGGEMKLNKGKTWFCVFQEHGEESLIIQ